MAFCRLLMSALAGADYQLGPHSRLLEIGVGWGRIYRVLLRETPDIVGIDPVPQCIELCRSALPGGQFEISSSTPPFRFSDGEFDVVYLYSVFSHLNEASFLAMLRETARIVRPGGFVLFTTVPPSEDFVRPRGFPESWKADAEAGRFLFVPTGGAHVAMPSSVWGWALVSEPYLRRVSSDLPFELAAYHPDHLPQAFVALRRLAKR
jgi:SAM-dependent methyltransferase